MIRRAGAKRGDLDLDPRCGRAPASGRRARPPCWCPSSSVPSRPCCSRCAPPTCRPCRADRISGRQDRPDDDIAAAAALREAAGGDRARRRPGRADRLSRSLSDLLRLSHPADGGAGRSGLWAHAQPLEVDEAFEVPLAFLMDAAEPRAASRDWKGVSAHYYAMPFGERYIWGVTAGILRNLHERISVRNG